MNLSKQQFQQLKKICIIRTDKLGDMVLTLPMFRIIKYINPQVQTILICSIYVSPLVEGIEFVDKIYYIEETTIKEINKIENIDLIFFPRAEFSEIWQSYISGIKYRVGTAYRLYSFLYTIKIKDHRKVSKFHEAEYNLRMISQITNETYHVNLVAPQINIKDTIYPSFNDNKQLIILHPGSNGSAKDITSETWRIVINKLLSMNFRLIITGLEKEKELCDSLANQSDEIINFCGKLSLKETIALISRCNCLIANSTGIIHIAASLNIATIGFYPNTPHIGAARWGPYNKKTLIVSPKHGDDMSLIDSEMVESAINQITKIMNETDIC
ncbi:MAG TPA: glycosyltransferase family 9 protein [Candidatus Kapabacteria bacterium]|nr:glycosyltransferase family 9 protein [Candidatus Kapabacteria bacterium]